MNNLTHCFDELTYNCVIAGKAERVVISESMDVSLLRVEAVAVSAVPVVRLHRRWPFR